MVWEVPTIGTQDMAVPGRLEILVTLVKKSLIGAVANGHLR